MMSDDAENVSPNEAARRFKAAFAPFWDLNALLADVEADATPFLSAGGWRQEKAESILSWKRRALESIQAGDAEGAAIYGLKAGATAEWLRAADVISTAEQEDFAQVTDAEHEVLQALWEARTRLDGDQLAKRTNGALTASGGFRVRLRGMSARKLIKSGSRNNPGYGLTAKGKRYLLWRRHSE